MQLKPIERPPMLSGEPERQLLEIRRYLERLAEGIEENMQIIAAEALTEAEKAAVRALPGKE